MLQFEENNIHNWWFIIESIKWFPKNQVIIEDNSAFLSTKNISCVYYLNVTLLYFFKIIYIMIEGQERMREKKEQKRREQSVYRWSVKNREQLMIMIFLHSRPCQIFAIESLNSLETLEQHVPKLFKILGLELLYVMENEKKEWNLNIAPFFFLRSHLFCVHF